MWIRICWTRNQPKWWILHSLDFLNVPCCWFESRWADIEYFGACSAWFELARQVWWVQESTSLSLPSTPHSNLTEPANSELDSLCCSSRDRLSSSCCYRCFSRSVFSILIVDSAPDEHGASLHNRSCCIRWAFNKLVQWRSTVVQQTQLCETDRNFAFIWIFLVDLPRRYVSVTRQMRFRISKTPSLLSTRLGWFSLASLEYELRTGRIHRSPVLRLQLRAKCCLAIGCLTKTHPYLLSDDSDSGFFSLSRRGCAPKSIFRASFPFLSPLTLLKLQPLLRHHKQNLSVFNGVERLSTETGTSKHSLIPVVRLAKVVTRWRWLEPFDSLLLLLQSIQHSSHARTVGRRDWLALSRNCTDLSPCNNSFFSILTRQALSLPSTFQSQNGISTQSE